MACITCCVATRVWECLRYRQLALPRHLSIEIQLYWASRRSQHSCRLDGGRISLLVFYYASLSVYVRVRVLCYRKLNVGERG